MNNLPMCFGVVEKFRFFVKFFHIWIPSNTSLNIVIQKKGKNL